MIDLSDARVGDVVVVRWDTGTVESATIASLDPHSLVPEEEEIYLYWPGQGPAWTKREWIIEWIPTPRTEDDK